MDSELQNAIAAIVGSIISERSLGGGCINDSLVIRTVDDHEYFLKTNSFGVDGFFEAEADGLRAIADTGTIRVPEVISVQDRKDATDQNQDGFLILEYIKQCQPGERDSDSEQLGRSLARMHQTSCQDHANAGFGFERDNFLGRTSQPNQWEDSWLEFWRQNRLGFQLKLAAEKLGGDSELGRRGDKLLNRLDKILGDSHSPSLVHGDLWSGNYMFDEVGDPVLIDPACYFGPRESEFGMITLFGGLGDRFYGAYNEVWPLQDGWKTRVEIYRLYHLLNHLNLFGNSYLDGCINILKKHT